MQAELNAMLRMQWLYQCSGSKAALIVIGIAVSQESSAHVPNPQSYIVLQTGYFLDIRLQSMATLLIHGRPPMIQFSFSIMQMWIVIS
jgi:hypothetical protein